VAGPRIKRPTRQAAARVRARISARDGFTIIEVLVASLVMTVGIVAMFRNFTSGEKLGNSAEAHQAAVAVAEGELERIRNLQWSQIGMHTIPARSAESTNPTFYEVSPATTKCTNMGKGANGTEKELANCYEWKWTEPATREPMVAEGEESYENPNTVKVTGVVKGATTRLTFKVYRFITWVTDSECKVTSCLGEMDSKRVVVAVTGNYLDKPVVLVSVLSDRELSGKNPLSSIECEEEKVKVACVSQS
jgi:prepilin-type N-terminal cleavage/methylation domain-containing protein